MVVAIMIVWATHCSVNPPESTPFLESAPEPAPVHVSAPALLEERRVGEMGYIRFGSSQGSDAHL